MTTTNMTNLEKAFNGGMTYDDATELFKKLTKKEIIEMLKTNIRESDECYIAVDTPFFELNSYVHCKKITFSGFDTMQIGKHEEKLEVSLLYGIEVEPDTDYDTTKFGSFNYNDSKIYTITFEHPEGNYLGTMQILV